MRFWDTSALACLFVEDPRTKVVVGLIERDEAVAVWWSTYVECWSAVARRRRQNRLPRAAEEYAARWIDLLRKSSCEIAPCEEIRGQARRLLNVHPLRSADALQLAAAIQWSGHGGGGEFVCFDERLADAARREGFDVVS